MEPIEQPATEQPEAPKVVFDDAQKARINELISAATKRAGAEARAEVARLKALPVAESQQSTDTLLRLADAESQLASMKGEAAESRVRDVLHKAVAGQGFFDPELCANILRSSIKLVDGLPVVVDQTGARRLGADFNPMTPSDLALELSTQKAFLVRGTMRPGAGSIMATNRTATEAIPLASVFGIGSNGALANKLAMRSPEAYRRMKLRAQEEGLI